MHIELYLHHTVIDYVIRAREHAFVPVCVPAVFFVTTP
jgi:hypothetical protein